MGSPPALTRGPLEPMAVISPLQLWRCGVQLSSQFGVEYASDSFCTNVAYTPRRAFGRFLAQVHRALVGAMAAGVASTAGATWRGIGTGIQAGQALMGCGAGQ